MARVGGVAVTDIVITEPGVYPDIPNDAYHRDPVAGGSLSSSGARKLLPPHCPAIYRHERDNPPDPKPIFDLGHAAHRLVLGVGPDIVNTGLDNRRGNAWKDCEAMARETGKVPLLSQDYEMVHDMAAALAQDPIAGPLFYAGHGTPEATLVWQDPRTGVGMRCRLDWLPDPLPDDRLIIPDYKTCVSADPDALAKAMHTYGYHQQAEWNRAGCQALDLADEAAQFVLVAQEKTPPYLVTVFQADHTAMRIAAMLNRTAVDVFRHCRETGVWPGYADEVQHLPLPRWVENEWSDLL